MTREEEEERVGTDRGLVAGAWVMWTNEQYQKKEAGQCRWLGPSQIARIDGNQVWIGRSGERLFVRNKAQLKLVPKPSSMDSIPIRRQKGRPPKQQTLQKSQGSLERREMDVEVEEEEEEEEKEEEEDEMGVKPKRPRGRPPKRKLDER